MDSQCYSGHSPVIDSATATVVCDQCCRVLDEKLTYEEINVRQFLTSTSPVFNKKEEKEEKEEIHHQPVIEVLRKIGDKLHLSESSIDNSYNKYYNIKKKVKKILLANPQAKNKRLLLSNENILGYSIYNSLKEHSCPRSIKEICYFSGISKPIKILQIEKFLESNRNEITPIKRLKPITPKDILLTHYPYIENFAFEDIQHIFHRLNCIGPTNFSPTTTSAGSVYLYMNYVKKCKKTLTQISCLFNVTPMSIQRFIKKYRNFF